MCKEPASAAEKQELRNVGARRSPVAQGTSPTSVEEARGVAVEGAQAALVA